MSNQERQQKNFQRRPTGKKKTKIAKKTRKIALLSLFQGGGATGKKHRKRAKRTENSKKDRKITKRPKNSTGKPLPGWESNRKIAKTTEK